MSGCGLEAIEVIVAGAEDAACRARKAVLAAELRDQPGPGDAETATAACSGTRDSPWPAGDGGCGASFLMCLACPNARVHSGHHPRLGHLHEALASLRSVLPPGAWAADWRDAHDRLEDLRGAGRPSGLGSRPWPGSPMPTARSSATCSPGTSTRDRRRGLRSDPLPLPTPASPIVAPHLASPLHAHLNGRYGDPVWPLAPLTGNPSTRKAEHLLGALACRRSATRCGWRPGNLINGQLRPTFLRGHSSQDARPPLP